MMKENDEQRLLLIGMAQAMASHAEQLQTYATNVAKHLEAPKPLGRPPKRHEDRYRTPSRTIRLDDERWAKLKQLGADWLRKQIDKETI